MMDGAGWGVGGFGIIWFLIAAALVVVPFWRLLPRFGMPSWLAIIAFIPLVALIYLWIMAFSKTSDR